MKRSTAIYLILIILIIILTGCTNLTDEENNTGQPTQITDPNPVENSTDNDPQDGYPIPGSDNRYPVEENNPMESAYPNLDPGREYGPSFTIDEPVDPNSTTVTGTGPAGVPIKLVDITTMGEELALTTVDENGNFSFSLDKPLTSGHAVGLMIGDLSDTDFNYDEFTYSDEYIDKPMIGTLFYIAVVP